MAPRAARPARSQRNDLGVGSPKALVMTDGDKLVFVNDDRADQRVWLDRTQALRGLEQSETHPMDVFILKAIRSQSQRLGNQERRFRGFGGVRRPWSLAFVYRATSQASSSPPERQEELQPLAGSL